MSAGAATQNTAGSTGQYSSPSAGPGVQENDGIPEAQEHHGGALDLSGTVCALGSDSVTIKTSSATTVYTIDSASDVDKNGEAKLSDLSVGDAVRFSVRSGTTTIDKLHAGDEAQDRPAGGPGGGGQDGVVPSSPTGGAGSSSSGA
jgi:hypothetical protein